MLTAKDARLLAQKQEPVYSENQLAQIYERIVQAAEKGKSVAYFPSITKLNQDKLLELEYTIKDAGKWNNQDNYSITWE